MPLVHMAKGNEQKAQSTATIDFEAKLWLTADKLRNNMDAAEYKHVVLGLIFPGAGLEIAWGPAARDFGRGQGGEAGASPQRAVTAEPTPATGKRPAARRGFGEKAGWLRCSSVGDRCGYPPDLQEEAVKTVLAQAELLCAEWV